MKNFPNDNEMRKITLFRVREGDRERFSKYSTLTFSKYS